MCILFVYMNPSPQPNGFRLIVASNRDEYYNRPAEAIRNIDGVVGGRDMENGREGGMWLGVSLEPVGDSKFRFGALLNITGENHVHGIKGRGFVVTDYLRGTLDCKQYMDELLGSGEPYNPFNFVAVDVKSSGSTVAHHCTNVSESYDNYDGGRALGFGNTSPKKSLTKVKAGTERFKEIVDGYGDVSKKDDLLRNLMRLLKSKEKHLPDSELEKRQPMAYESLSSIYIEILEAGYGSRTHSVVLLDYDWNVEFYEATMEEPIDPEKPTWATNVVKARL